MIYECGLRMRKAATRYVQEALGGCHGGVLHCGLRREALHLRALPAVGREERVLGGFQAEDGGF